MVNSNNNKRAVGTKQSKEYIKKLIQQIAIEAGVPVDLALAIAKHESGFNPNASHDNGKGLGVDQGVFQINNKWHKLKNPFDPAENVKYGINFIKKLLDVNNGDIRAVLRQYNTGSAKPSKVGDAYADKVLGNVPKNSPVLTGGAAPVSANTVVPQDAVTVDPQMGERLGAIQADYTNLAERGIGQYASNPYDAALGLGLRGQRSKEAVEQFNQARSETPLDLTPEQQQELVNNFIAQNQAVQNVYADAANRLQGMAGPQAYAPYEQKIKDAYEAQIARLQAANPYTRLGQMAPIDLDKYAQAVAQQQAAEDYANNKRGVFAALDFMDPNVKDKSKVVTRDFAAEAQRRADLAQQLARAQQAAQVARQTGLTPTEFIQGGIADYNQMSAVLTAQNQLLGNIYQRAMAGDQQAMQILTGIAQNTQANIVNNQVNAYKALQDARARQLETAKANWEMRKGMLDYAGNLDPSMVQGANQVQTQNIGTAGSMYNTGMNAGVNAGRNMVGYETSFIPGVNGQATDANLIKPQQYGATLLNAAAQTNDPNAFQDAVNTYNAIAAQYGNFDPRFIPQMNTNTFRRSQQ